MKPVEFEIIMRDGTHEGMQSASGNVDVLNAKNKPTTIFNYLKKFLCSFTNFQVDLYVMY